MTPIPFANPYINVSNWPMHHAEGWRWARNLQESTRENQHSNNAVIEAYQESFGAAKVTLGNAWNEQYRGPAGVAGKFGVYVKDTEALVDALYKGIEAIESGEKEL